MAFAAVTSLMSTIHESMQLTGCNLQQFYDKLESLRAIMEKPCGNLEALTSLEAEIIELAGYAEDMVDLESRNFYSAKNTVTQRLDSWDNRSFLKQAGRLIDSMKNRWMAKLDNKDLKPQNLYLASASQLALEPEDIMVGFDEEFEMIQDQLARGSRELEVVSIVGMGGIGKTTLASKIYADPFITSHFDIRAKVTISQEYCTRNVIIGLLSSIGGKTQNKFEQDDGLLADRLQKLLKGRRYLVVIDDIWTTGAWEDIQLCFPESNCGSRILMTTRNMDVAEYASSGVRPYQMRLMNFYESWNLLLNKISEVAYFPPEFQEIGKQIALNCKGLPLAIIVIAGLLQKVGYSLNEWIRVAENIASLVSANLDTHCMRVLALSYRHLPHHLKACFLYFAVFPEDKLILVKKLVNLWVAEGFLKEEETKSMEEVAEKCLKDLIDRSLIIIKCVSFDGKIKACGMHDVIRELCLREAREINFVNVITDSEQSRGFTTKHRVRISIQSEESTFVDNQLAMVQNNGSCSIFLFIENLSTSRMMQQLKRFKVHSFIDHSPAVSTNFDT